MSDPYGSELFEPVTPEQADQINTAQAAAFDALSADLAEGKSLARVGEKNLWFYEYKFTEESHTRWAEAYTEEGALKYAARSGSTGRIRRITTRTVVLDDKITEVAR